MAGTAGAAAAIVDGPLLCAEPRGDAGLPFEVRFAEGHVEHFSATGAEEVGVGRGVGIEADVALVDGELDGCPFLGEQAERVVHRGLGERGHRWVEGAVNLVGINLLREGLDLPEVSLVAILDADKEGLLRSETSLVQTIGRAARNENGTVIMYACLLCPPQSPG